MGGNYLPWGQNISLIRVFPKIDHSDINARIVLEQNKFSKKVRSMSDRDWTLNPRVAGSIPVRDNFLPDLFCSNTILAKLPELFILVKARMRRLLQLTS